MNNLIELIEKLPITQLQSCICIDFVDGEPPIYIDGINGVVTEHELDSIDATFRLESEDLDRILHGEESAVSLFTSGKIEVDGDISVAFRLKEIMG